MFYFSTSLAQSCPPGSSTPISAHQPTPRTHFSLQNTSLENVDPWGNRVIFLSPPHTPNHQVRDTMESIQRRISKYLNTDPKETTHWTLLPLSALLWGPSLMSSVLLSYPAVGQGLINPGNHNAPFGTWIFNPRGLFYLDYFHSPRSLSLKKFI